MDRRSFFQSLAAAGVAATLSGTASAQAVRPGTPAPAPLPTTVAREFDDPYLELVRLLREASEIEHGLLLQYLYAGFSLKPKYAALRGTGTPSATDFLGVAVQEMRHLGAVNRLLVALGAGPNLMPQDFPYQPDIYPFEFTLEPLSPHSLAKYIYTEAPLDAFNDFRPPELGREIERALGRGVKPNHVGSLYNSVLARLGDLEAESNRQPLPTPVDFADWRKQLIAIKNEGEADHFRFFRSVFTASHPAFGMRSDVWQLPINDPNYPANPLPHNPSALAGHPNQIQEPRALRLAWLGNLHYWAMLSLLDYGYRYDAPAFIQLAEQHMQGPLLVLALELASRGAGMPFEQLSTGYAPASGEQQAVYFILRLLRETKNEETALKSDLPPVYSAAVTTASLEEVTQLWSAAQRLQSYRRRG